MAEMQYPNSTGHSIEFSVPRVRELTQTVKPVTLNTLILDVLILFQTHTDLSALPVLDDSSHYYGIISRRHYLNMLTRAFARELYARKKLSYLLKNHANLFVAPLIVDAEERIDEVMVKFLSRDPGLMYEALPVVDQTGVMGVVKVADMMLKMSESQGQLIAAMQQLSARLNEEVANAARLQRNLLRPARIALPGLQGHSTMITSSEVGGDFYDYYAVDGRWVVILVGDVSGHGIAAGTIVCAAKAAVNFLQAENEKEPHIILSRLSNVIFNTAHQSLLMTMFAVCIDTRNGEVRYANAGHQFAYLYRAMLGQLDVLEAGGLPLGKNEVTEYEQLVTEIDLGDRLFLYTDSIVEEENAEGECFGYERLEELLITQADNDIETLCDTLLEDLTQYLGRSNFEDDVTLFCVEHFERTFEIHQPIANILKTAGEPLEPNFILDSHYRANPESISRHILRQDLVFLAEQDFADLIPSLSTQGVRRMLPKTHPINEQLGWGTLLDQHLSQCDNDLAMFLRHPDQRREFHLSHSEDKAFIINEIEAWLLELDLPHPERIDEVIFLLDEIIENGLYAAPRDGKGRPLFAKGISRELETGERLRLDLSIQHGLLGISLTDSWGTLTPNVFLNRLSHHVLGLGLDSGVGGGGLYLIWRMSDYLQLRVFPNQQTQVCVFLDLKTPFNDELDKGFQFLYHTEVQEVVVHEQI